MGPSSAGTHKKGEIVEFLVAVYDSVDHFETSTHSMPDRLLIL